MSPKNQDRKLNQAIARRGSGAALRAAADVEGRVQEDSGQASSLLLPAQPTELADLADKALNGVPGSASFLDYMRASIRRKPRL